MKSIAVAFMLFTWFVFTLIFTCTIVGMTLFIPDTYNPSTWMKIGMDLKDKLIS